VGWWYQSQPPKVLNPMPWDPDKEWLESEWDEVLDWFFKDVTESDLADSGIKQFIERWANKI